MLSLVLLAIAGASLWLFSRFTVDDAFISWRYGRNVVEFGVWNYNPVYLDTTQAYTNPLFAVLSVLPNAIGVDTVLFFKMISLITVGSFASWYSSKSKARLPMVLAFVALPATIIHAFSGLETFFFVALLASLLIFISEGRFYSSILVTLALFVVRPESWPLAALVPTYFLLSPSSFGTTTAGRLLGWKPFVFAGIFLVVPLLAYFAFHNVHFGSALPNTFYVKSSNSLNLVHLLKFSFWAAPVLLLLFLKKTPVLLFAAVLFASMIASYSSSNLLMNYAGRFEFHIFAPVYLFVLYILTNSAPDCPRIHIGRRQLSVPTPLLKAGLVGFLFVFAFRTSDATTLLQAATYYPRAIDSHGALGKTLRLVAQRHSLTSFTLGDAGMVAYQSRLLALDNVGLASTAVARDGVTKELLDQYRPDLILLHANAEGVRLAEFGQSILLDWALTNKMLYICDVYWRPGYTIRVYSRTRYAEIVDVCSRSQRLNDREDVEYLRESWRTPPWSYWRE